MQIIIEKIAKDCPLQLVGVSILSVLFSVLSSFLWTPLQNKTEDKIEDKTEDKTEDQSGPVGDQWQFTVFTETRPLTSSKNINTKQPHTTLSNTHATLGHVFRRVRVFHSTFKILGPGLRNLAPPNRTLTPRFQISTPLFKFLECFITESTLFLKHHNNTQNTQKRVSLHKLCQKNNNKNKRKK